MAAEVPLKLETGPNQVHRMQSGDTIAASFLDAAVVTLTGTQTLTDKTLTEPIVEKIKTLGGQVAIETLSNTSAVNYVQVKPQVTTGGPLISAVGADTNIDITLASKGSGVPKMKIGTASSANIVDVSTAQTLTNKTLTAPIIGATEWGAAGHAHAGGPSGGTLDLGACVTLNTKVPTTSLPVINPADITEIGTFFSAGTTGPILRAASTSILAGSPGAIAANSMFFWPFFAPRRTTVTLDTVNVRITVASPAGGLMRMAIYTNTSATAPKPVALVSGSGTIATDATGLTTWTPTVSLSGGRLYWIGFCFDATAVSGALDFVGYADTQPYFDLGIATIASGTQNPLIGYRYSGGTFAAFPSTLPDASYTTGVMIAWGTMLRIATGLAYSA